MFLKIILITLKIFVITSKQQATITHQDKDIKMDKLTQQARRAARKQVRHAKHTKGFLSGEQASKVQKAIKNSK